MQGRACELDAEWQMDSGRRVRRARGRLLEDHLPRMHSEASIERTKLERLPCLHCGTVIFSSPLTIHPEHADYLAQPL